METDNSIYTDTNEEPNKNHYVDSDKGTRDKVEFDNVPGLYIENE